MPPTSPWGKKKTQEPNFPGPSGVKSSKVHKSQYEEIQEDELIALGSIYGEDFRQIEKTQVAWKVFHTTTLPDSLLILIEIRALFRDPYQIIR
jgi:hypothetical protein